MIAELHDRFPRCLFNSINFGVAGDTMTLAIRRIDQDVLRYEPDLTIVALGLNNAGSGLVNLPTYTAALEQGISRIVAHSAVIVLTPCMMATCLSPAVPLLYQKDASQFINTQVSGVLDTYVETMRETAHRLQVPLADTYARWQALAARGVDTTSMLINGLTHPAGYAHRLYVDALLACFEAL